MSFEYQVKRKLQEQSGSYFVTLPKIWVTSRGLKEGDIMSLKFNGIIKVEPLVNKSFSQNRQESTSQSVKNNIATKSVNQNEKLKGQDQGVD